MKRFLVFLLGLVPLAAAAQTIPVNPKFGAVSDAEVDMAVYEPDTSAAAVILYRDYQASIDVDRVNLDFVYERTVYTRIKILKESGKDYADFELFYDNSKNAPESVTGVKVVTYNREGGKIVMTKMSKKFLFDEKYSDRVNRVSFTAENVKVGSVIEMSYTFKSPYFWIVPDIYLQQGIPINSERAEICYAEYLDFNRIQRGGIPMQFQQETTSHTIGMGSGMLTYSLKHDIFMAHDVPRLAGEDFCYYPAQYRASLVYDLRSLYVPGGTVKNYSTSWADVDEAFVDAGLLKAVTARFKDMDGLHAAVDTVSTDTGKIDAVRKFIIDRVKWDGSMRVLPESASSVLKKGTGSAADINALVASALNSLGFKVKPVLVKRRSSGMLYDFHIAMDTFDRFVLLIAAPDGTEGFLDAAPDEGYLNVLNPMDLVTKARLLHEGGNGEWVNIADAAQNNRINESVSMTVSADGAIEGKTTIVAMNEISYDVRRHYNDADSEEDYITEIENDEGIRISEFSISKDYSPRTTVEYSFEDDADASGDYIYINPFLSSFHSESSFRKEERKLPVDFPYPDSIIYTCIITLPEGYAVEEMPEAAKMTCAPLKANIFVQCRNNDDKMVILSYRCNMGVANVQPEDYETLRLFWEKAAGIEKSTIVLKKK